MKLRLFRASLIAVWAWSSAGAQENVPRVGYLRYTTEASDSEREWFVQGLRELGWEDGRNIKSRISLRRRRHGGFEPSGEGASRFTGSGIRHGGDAAYSGSPGRDKHNPSGFRNVSDPIAEGSANSLPRPGNRRHARRSRTSAQAHRAIEAPRIRCNPNWYSKEP